MNPTVFLVIKTTLSRLYKLISFIITVDYPKISLKSRLSPPLTQVFTVKEREVAIVYDFWLEAYREIEQRQRTADRSSGHILKVLNIYN